MDESEQICFKETKLKIQMKILDTERVRSVQQLFRISKNSPRKIFEIFKKFKNCFFVKLYVTLSSFRVMMIIRKALPMSIIHSNMILKFLKLLADNYGDISQNWPFFMTNPLIKDWGSDQGFRISSNSFVRSYSLFHESCSFFWVIYFKVTDNSARTCFVEFFAKRQ